MKDIKELLKIVREHTYNYMMEYGHGGLCTVVSTLEDKAILTNDEARVLTEYIEQYMPDDYFNRQGTGYYGWEPGLIPPRLKWIDEQIKNKS